MVIRFHVPFLDMLILSFFFNSLKLVPTKPKVCFLAVISQLYSSVPKEKRYKIVEKAFHSEIYLENYFTPPTLPNYVIVRIYCLRNIITRPILEVLFNVCAHEQIVKSLDSGFQSTFWAKLGLQLIVNTLDEKHHHPHGLNGIC